MQQKLSPVLISKHNPNIFGEFRILFRLMSPRLRYQLAFTLFLMLICILAEMATIGAVLTFITVATDSDSNLVIGEAREWLKAIHPDPLFAASIFLVVTAIFSTFLRLAMYWTSQIFVVKFGANLASNVFKKIIRQPYSKHAQRNSSEALSAISKVNDIVYGYVQPLMEALISVTMAISISLILFVISPFAAGIASITIVLAYVLAARLSFNHLQNNSEIIATMMTQRTKIVQESLGGIRDIILGRLQGLSEKKFAVTDERLRAASGINSVISSTPRHIVEAVGILAMVFVTTKMSASSTGFKGAIPTLGAICYGALRLLPLVQSAWRGLSAAIGNRQLLLDVMEYVNLSINDHSLDVVPITFTKQLSFQDVSFRYASGDLTLEKVSFDIQKGEHIGISGITGSGKSTLLDLILGLLSPDEGRVLIDGTALENETRYAWQACVSHVPQSIFLIDDTIAANVVFGTKSVDIDEARLKRAISIAQLDSFLATLPLGWETRVGERGVRLSGGQRQRIGIARALYQQAPLLVLDEATSALDSATEAAIMNAISNLPEAITVLTVAHRDSTLAYCDRILNVLDGKVSWN